jgi:hypothetical protein
MAIHHLSSGSSSEYFRNYIAFKVGWAYLPNKKLQEQLRNNK